MLLYTLNIHTNILEMRILILRAERLIPNEFDADLSAFRYYLGKASQNERFHYSQQLFDIRYYIIR